MSKRFSLAKIQAAENFNRWNKSRIWRGILGDTLGIKSTFDSC